MAKYEKINEKGLPIKVIDIFLPEGNKTVNEIYANLEDKSILGNRENHWHEELEIILPVFGVTQINLEQHSFTISQGDYYIITSKEIHNVFSKSDDPYKGYCLQIGHDFLKNHLPNYDEIEFVVPTNLEHKQAILSAVYAVLVAYIDNDEYKYLNVEAKTLELLRVLMKYASKKKDEVLEVKSEKYKKQIMDIVKYIDKNCNEDLSVVSIADHFGLSYGYVSKIFKNHYGTTMKNYLTTVRLKNSVDDLLNTDLPIIQIALKNGFPNSKSFYKEFEERYKMKPSQYRKEMK